MSTITALRNNRGSGKRYNIYLDGRYAFSLDSISVIKEELKVGQELTTEQVETLKNSVQFSQCLNAAYRYLTYRARSEMELIEHLRKRRFNDDDIRTVIGKLKEQGLIDDTAFAQSWKESRTHSNPRSQWLTGYELKKKGVAPEIIEEAVSDIDDEEAAYLAAQKKAHILPVTDYQVFRRRLAEFLKRRGFGYGVINKTIKRLWQEHTTES